MPQINHLLKSRIRAPYRKNTSPNIVLHEKWCYFHAEVPLKCKFYESPDKLKQYSGLGGTFLSACENLNARIEAMNFLGIEGPRFSFSTRLSRNTMEYYDSFVFSFFSNLYPELPPIAQGGRYDALTAVLNKKVNCPAVGGIIRPEILLNLTGRQQ